MDAKANCSPCPSVTWHEKIPRPRTSRPNVRTVFRFLGDLWNQHIFNTHLSKKEVDCTQKWPSHLRRCFPSRIQPQEQLAFIFTTLSWERSILRTGKATSKSTAMADSSVAGGITAAADTFPSHLHVSLPIRLGLRPSFKKLAYYWKETLALTL